MASIEEWNELVSPEDVYPSPKKNRRQGNAAGRPSHLVVHITGTDDLESVKNTFMTSVSAHYLIGKDGRIFQFVRDADRAWHAGITSSQRRLYRRANTRWHSYLQYFEWYRGYPGDARFVDEDLRPVGHHSEAVFVEHPSRVRWGHYDYFEMRWPGQTLPVNFEVDPDPNNYSIGIECLSIGKATPHPQTYTEEMYRSLDRLVENLCAKYGIPRTRQFVVGHEDVNPLARFGWDPNAGFEWDWILRGS